ncbi:unnamed protein product [Symbiodinium sp. CCMP2456]|nr:unnamed protein product [Symbiodinium sp. CCMP2456]
MVACLGDDPLSLGAILPKRIRLLLSISKCKRDMMCDVANSLDVSSNLWPSALDESKARDSAPDP